MYKSIFPTEVTVIVHKVKNIKPKKSDLKFCVIISIGNVKYRTDLIQDASGCPQFDTESVLHVENPKLPLQLVVTEKKEKEFFGQLIIPMESLGSVRMNREIITPVQPYKKCSKPTAEIHYEAWISKCITSIAPEIKIFENNNEVYNQANIEKKGPLSGLKKTFNSITHSPLMNRKSKGSDQQGSFHKNLDLQYSSSCLDLSNANGQKNNGKNKTLFSLLKRNNKQMYGSSLTLYNQGSHKESNYDTTVPYDSHSTVQQSDNDNIICNNDRFVDNESEEDDNASKVPEISGISPNIGTSSGGTKITIRGQNLGKTKEDIIGLFVCGSNILNSLEYISSSKILCTTKPWKPGEGCITLETQSGGKVNSTLKFTFKDEFLNECNNDSTVKRAESWKKDEKEKHRYLDAGSPDMVRKNKNKLNVFMPLSNCRSMTDITNCHKIGLFGSSKNISQDVNNSKNSSTLNNGQTVQASKTMKNNPPVIQIFPYKNEQPFKKKIEQELIGWKTSATDLNMKTIELEEENKRLKGYIEKLVTKIMVKCPDVLCTD